MTAATAAPIRCRVGAACLAPLALAVLACGGSEAPAGGGEPPTAARVYRVGAHIARLPTAADPLLYLDHEAIPTFVGPSGEVEGMAAMTMPFQLADGVSLAGFAAGDPVMATLRVDWAAGQPVVVTAIEPAASGAGDR